MHTPTTNDINKTDGSSCSDQPDFQDTLASTAKIFDHYVDNIVPAVLDLFHSNLALCQEMLSHGKNASQQPPEIVTDAVVQDVANFYENLFSQSFSVWNRLLKDLTHSVLRDNPEQKEQVLFHLQQNLSALNPENFFSTNPNALVETYKSNFENVKRGIENFKRDFSKKSITMTDETAFVVGENIATTLGEIVYENPLFQLIRYTPKTESVFETPVLVIPPMINKYYIMDLQENNSYVKWLVEKGHQVYLMSWVNPIHATQNLAFEDYLLQGPMAALSYLKNTKKLQDVNLVGYCIGGTLLAVLLAYLKKKNSPQIAIKSATFLTTAIDFSVPGEVWHFMDTELKRQLLYALMQKDGMLPGHFLQMTFNMMRPESLFWPYIIQNYFLGKTPAPMDLLYWNTDSTNVPQKFMEYYLENMYVKNLLSVPNALVIDGVPLDMSAIDIPSYFLATVKDHIVPWQTVYKSAQLFAGPNTFVLSGSGHIAGVINPPSQNKYFYLTNPTLAATGEDWLKQTKETSGSWWSNWENWIKPFAGKKVQVTPASDEALIEPAPGSYVKVKWYS